MMMKYDDIVILMMYLLVLIWLKEGCLCVSNLLCGSRVSKEPAHFWHTHTPQSVSAGHGPRSIAVLCVTQWL